MFPSTTPQFDASNPAGRPAPGAYALRACLFVVSSLVISLAPSSNAFAQPGGVLEKVGFDQKLNTQIPLTLKFRNEEGREVLLADYFGKRPVMLVLGYKSCPMLCSQVLAELTRSLKVLDQSVGKDFDVLNVSINPRETPEEADSQRRAYLKRYGREGASEGWHSLVGDKASIDALANSIGFRYQYSDRTGLFAHAAGFALLTAEGRISRYFYGVEYPNRELKYALITASEHKIGSPIERVVLYCYDYDPTTGKYTFAVMRAIQILGVLTALALGTYLFVQLRRDRRMGRATGSTFNELPSGPAIP